MSTARIAALRRETVEMFFHGYHNYIEKAFPDDEIRPISCKPLTRDRDDDRHYGLNDALGNYSLTLLDSLSTLAVIASSPDPYEAELALHEFEHGVALLIEQYGDGTDGPTGLGLKARGFDLDSKVQVFETTIRGLGGLLSAHLFATGDLPIQRSNCTVCAGEHPFARPIWSNGLKYDGQLLRLAHDLGRRLLPAFQTPTGIPYPRVNLRRGLEGYATLSSNICEAIPSNDPSRETTETCSAGAGSLVLEFTVLSRLVGDPIFEEVAENAFFEIWRRRSPIDLVGAGIDAITGVWMGPVTSIGAGTDSFHEIAFKSYILHSSLETSDLGERPSNDSQDSQHDPREIALSYLQVWKESHAAIKRHLFSPFTSSQWRPVHLTTGSPQAHWVDSLSAYYPGLLVLTGEVEEAIAVDMLYVAIWTKYSALPERFSTSHSGIDNNLGWWPGRPEFLESTYHLFTATRDPWYLHVGEMALRDIQRRCRAECGWSGIQDVRTGSLNDRQESYFLAETAKYLYLLFDPRHPLNTLDSGIIWSTESHPLLIPKAYVSKGRRINRTSLSLERRYKPLGSGHQASGGTESIASPEPSCSIAPKNVPLSLSHTTSRPDYFHAVSMTRLHLEAKPRHLNFEDAAAQVAMDTERYHSTINETHQHYPWTLPASLLPLQGMSSALVSKPSFSIAFPLLQGPLVNGNADSSQLVRMDDGIVIRRLAGLSIGVIKDALRLDWRDKLEEDFRIHRLGYIQLGRDEKVFCHRNEIRVMSDPNFMAVRDEVMVDLILDLASDKSPQAGNVGPLNDSQSSSSNHETSSRVAGRPYPSTETEDERGEAMMQLAQIIRQHLPSAVPTASASVPIAEPIPRYSQAPAIRATGVGATDLPEFPDVPSPGQLSQMETELPWQHIYVTDELCDHTLPLAASSEHSVIVVKRGGCSFSQKLANIPVFQPSNPNALRLVIVVSYPHQDSPKGHAEHDDAALVRPLLDEPQQRGGLPRKALMPLILVNGGHRMYIALRAARRIGIRRRWHVEAQGTLISNLIVT